MKTLLGSLIFFFLLFSYGQKNVLQLNLKTGDTYMQNTDFKMNIQQEIAGQSLDMAMDVGGKMSYKVLESHKDSYTLEVRYIDLSMGMDMQGMKMEYNSKTQDSSDIMSSIFSNMTDVPFQIVLSKSGKVVEVKDIESLYNSMFDQFPDIPEEQRNQIKEQISQSYGEEAFKGSLEMITSIFPDKAVGIKDTWEVKTVLNSSYKADVLSSFTLVEATDTFYRLKGTSQIGSDDEPEFKKVNGNEMQYNMTGSMISDIIIDKETGWIIEANIIQDIEGIVSIEESDALPEGMQWPMKLEGKLNITN